MGDFCDQTFSLTALLLGELFPTTELEEALHNRPTSSSLSLNADNGSVKELLEATLAESEKSISTSSVTTKSHSSVTGTTENGHKNRDAYVADVEHQVSSYTRSLVDTPMIDHENPTSYSIGTNCPSKDESNSVLKDISMERHLGLNPKNKEMKEPWRKKMKLSKTVEIPVEDVFSRVHTRLCKSDCTIKHNPLVLAICAQGDSELRNSLENHFKLAIKGDWKSVRDFQDHTSKPQMYDLVHLAVLFGKCNLLEFLLQSFVNRSKLFVDSAQNSPLHSLVMFLDCFMPSSSHNEKVATFKRILQLITKYNCNALLVRNNTNGDSILHACVKQIRKLTTEIKSLESLADDNSELQGLIDQRQLVEIFLKEMISTLKMLCADGSLDYSQVIKLFECPNKAGETMLQILKDDESDRNNNRNVNCQEASTALAEIGSTEHVDHQTCINKDLSSNNITDENSSVLSVVSTPSLTVQNGNDQVVIEPSNSTLYSGTVMSTTDHLSIQAPRNQSLPTTVPNPVGIPHTVMSTRTEMFSETATSSTHDLPDRTPDKYPGQSVSNVVSNPVTTAAVKSKGTMNFSTTCYSSLAGYRYPNTSSTFSTSARMFQAYPSTSVANLLGTSSSWTNWPSVHSSHDCQNRCLSATAASFTSVKIPQTMASTQVTDLSGSTTLSTNCLPCQAACNSCPKQSVTSAAATCPSVRMPQPMGSTQVTVPSGTTTSSSNCLSAQAACNKSPNQSTSASVSMSVAPSYIVNSEEPTSCTLTHSGISVPTSNLSTVRPKSAIPGRHTFLCSDSCSVKHHKLIQLLCATPDHLRNDSRTMELESCREFKKYLEDTRWDMHTIVPDRMPSLCYPIVHLACLLGKHKALKVLSELGFHPLVHANINEETPLHMTVKLLRYKTASPLFLSHVVVSIVKTLNQHSHAISLFSAKDKSGNSVLHAMAKVIQGNSSDSPASVLHVHLFRVFIHFLLKGQHTVSPSACVQILSSCLKDYNKAGQDVEFLLQRSTHGQQLLEYLRGLMQAMQEMSAGVPSLTTTLTLQHRVNEEAGSQKEGKDGSERQIQCGSSSSSHTDLPTASKDDCGHPEEQHTASTNEAHGRHTVGMGAQLMNEEPESLVDFILSEDCKISYQSKKWILECYITEYHNRVHDIDGRLQMLKGIISRNKWNTGKMNLKRGEWENKKRKQSLIQNKIQLIEKLTKACEQWVTYSVELEKLYSRRVLNM